MTHSLQAYLKLMLKNNASDLHLKVGRPPLMRLNGSLIPVKTPDLEIKDVEGMIFPLISDSKRKDLEKNRQVDFSFLVPEQGRFRCNVYYQKGTVSVAIRLIPIIAPKFEDLGIPEVVRTLSGKDHGLYLITGATGAGKSTTLASLVNHLNETTPHHLLMIEDPIEFVFTDKRATVTQREIGSDATSFAEALRGGLRQDPDVIILGELRDQSTIQAALTAAETGHLVIGTLHTNDARASLERILDVFPAAAQNQIRIQMASCLLAVVSQKLVLKKDNSGRVVICEVMVKSPVIESYILKNEFEKIQDAMSQSHDYYQMQTFNGHLEQLIRSGVITLEEGVVVSNNPEDLKLRLSGIEREEGYRVA